MSTADIARSAAGPAGSSRDHLLSRRGAAVPPKPLLTRGDREPGRITFTFGFPDPASLPAGQVAESTVRVLATDGESALQYGANAGHEGLVDELLRKFARDQGFVARRENVLITAGGSQALHLLLDAFIDWGDTVISEMPIWLGAVGAFRNAGVNVVGVPVDDEGTDVVALERELNRLRDAGVTPKFIYVVSNFQNPTGVSTTVPRRRRMVELAREHGTLIVEDDAYFDLRYDGNHLPSIYALDAADGGSSVIYLGTLSKTMGPGLRIGWLVGPPDLVHMITSLKIDGGTNIFGSHVAADWLPRHLEDHVRGLRATYRDRRDAMLAALERHMPPGSTWTRPDGGFFVWLTLPEGVDTVAMLPQVQERGVDYLPGPRCYTGDGGRNQIRLAFSFADESQIERGIRIIGEVAAGELREQSAPAPPRPGS